MKNGEVKTREEWWIMRSYREKNSKYPKHEYLLNITDLSEVQRENLRKVLKNPESVIIMEGEIKEKAERYLDKARPLFEGLALIANTEKGRKFYKMAMNYYNDAIYFYNNGNFIGAIIALEYAEGWLDAGVFINFLRTNKK